MLLGETSTGKRVPPLDGTEPAPVVAVQEVVKTTTTLVTATE